MTSPETQQADPNGIAKDAPPAMSFSASSILRKRADFLKASRARRQVMPGFILQARQRGADEPSVTPIRIGYTCSKKVGNAVARNRAKRRLREIARANIPDQGKSGWDYVLIGRRLETATRPYQILLQDLATALERIHAPRKPRR
ncbi:MAG: ribonuclease P protein component [Rhodobacteraceae bacterium]|nr:ribonuclease P protein component [Paracoccaceae bacterium]